MLTTLAAWQRASLRPWLTLGRSACAALEPAGLLTALADLALLNLATGEAAYELIRDEERLLGEIAGRLKVPSQDAPARVTALLEERRRLERELVEARKRVVSGTGTAAGKATVKGVAYQARKLEGVPARELRGMADALTKEVGSGVAALVSVVDGKAALVVSVSKDLEKSVDAVALLRAGVAELGGKGGGGRPDFAQGGGPDGTRADAALAAIERGLARHSAAAE